ncbi:hypothetical protein ABW19_dt0206039 [Dactylella cylindrospora]|nr:hypothetical protein ABW19_dt0206039 [Dactylella cylindrospora]
MSSWDPPRIVQIGNNNMCILMPDYGMARPPKAVENKKEPVKPDSPPKPKYRPIYYDTSSSHFVQPNARISSHYHVRRQIEDVPACAHKRGYHCSEGHYHDLGHNDEVVHQSPEKIQKHVHFDERNEPRYTARARDLHTERNTDKRLHAVYQTNANQKMNEKNSEWEDDGWDIPKSKSKSKSTKPKSKLKQPAARLPTPRQHLAIEEQNDEEIFRSLELQAQLGLFSPDREGYATPDEAARAAMMEGLDVHDKELIIGVGTRGGYIVTGWCRKTD